MEWVEGFYSRTGAWWGPAESRITERDHERLRTLDRLCGPGPKRVLDLGSSYGNTAAVLARAGHAVVGVELSDRVAFARQYAADPGAGSLAFVHGDFFAAAFGARFDAVCYWNGFGTGSDADQRRLLRRIATEWLDAGGAALVDVANPTRWIGWTGDEEYLLADPAAGYAYAVRERIDFDPVRNRFLDTWWEDGKPENAVSQSIRCYSPADFLLLLEGTGLAANRMEVDGRAFDPGEPSTAAHPLWTRNEYLVRLTPTPTTGG